MIYCYTNADGETIERQYSACAAPKQVCVDGVCYDRDIAAEHGGRTMAHARWPMKSDGAGVHPDSIPEFEQFMASRGVPTKWDRRTGEAIFRSRGHRRDAMKALGLHDRDGGYGDG